jgi:hypothetical protein
MLYFFIFLGLFVKLVPLNETPGPSRPYPFKKICKWSLLLYGLWPGRITLMKLSRTEWT